MPVRGREVDEAARDDLAVSATAAAMISARLDRLPATRTVWTLVLFLSLGGFFEFYDLFFTGYIGPGLMADGLFTATTQGFFGINGFASFVAAFFMGLFIGTVAFSYVADRLGRRTIFTVSLLWYTVCTVVMAFQYTAGGINLWRFLAGIGIGVELVTIDTYISELVPKHIRGRAFAINQTLMFTIIPLVAALSWWLVPLKPLGLDGWRWIVLISAAGAVVVWYVRLRVPESPRWLAQHGAVAEADRILSAMETRVAAETGRPLPPPVAAEPVLERGSFAEIWGPAYLKRTVMLILFNVFQTVGFYGFSNWVPTLLISRGIDATKSLQYTFIIAVASPFGPLLSSLIADRIERKWQIVGAAICIAVSGLLFAQASTASMVILLGVVLTLSNGIISSFHAYQAELYPTRIRALAVGFVYSWSRLSVVFMAFVIAFTLGNFGVPGVFWLIAGSMAVVCLAVGILGPSTRDRSLEAISQ